MSRFIRAIFFLGLIAPSSALNAQAPLWRSPQFVVTDTSVRQGPFEAVALSRDRIVSTYPRAAREVMFKFSINGKDNEFPPGQDHMVYLRPRDGRIVTPVYTFGELDPPLAPEPVQTPTSEEGVVDVTVRLDMRHVLESFRREGAYDPPNGRPVPADSFLSVYIIGNEEPLSWDLQRLEPGSTFELTDPDGDGIYTVTLPFEARYTRPVDDRGRAVWSLTADLSGFPTYASSQRIVDALYRLSLEEMVALIRDDGGITGGARWPEVWTRDLAWGAILAMAPLAPDAVRASLLMKVDGAGRIVQDTGTGGSWPVSTDRVAWAVAAWELYKVIGDRDWLRTAFHIIRRSAEADLAVALDPTTGLFRGESSFLDWRQQSYPAWMDPKDIHLSQALGTNALHYATYRVLERMARELGEPSSPWADVAESLRWAMNEHLWQDDRGYYGQFLYGRNFPVLSPRAEALGEAFAILFGVAGADRARSLTSRMPVVPFGVPSFWPYIPDVPPYHNAGIWPQVVGFWIWAAAEADNEEAVAHGLASLIRPAALFLTNKENMVAATGHFEGTELNSDRLVGSVGAMLAAVQRILLGMRYHPERLVFEPYVPAAYDGERTYRGLRYRDAVLTVTVRGYGSGVARAALDGRRVPRAEIPGDLSGEHTLDIVLDGRLPTSAVNMEEDLHAPPTPQPRLEDQTLVWEPVPGSIGYVVYRNGEVMLDTATPAVDIPPPDGLTEVQVLARGARGMKSFLSEPHRGVPPADQRIVQPPGRLEREHGGFTGDGYLRIGPTRNASIRFPVRIDRPGIYSVDIRYANGSGPINSGSAAAVRTLSVDGRRAGSVVMPQRGRELWDDWGYSSHVRVRLEPGLRTLELDYTEADRNMARVTNDALIDHVRVARLPSDARPLGARPARE